MTAKTITSVNEEPRHWTSDDKKISLAFITVTFGDGSQGSVACKPDNTENVIKILQGLRGKESEFDLEAKEDYNGIPQFKVKGYPGKPGQQDGQRPFGGGGGRPSGSRHDPETNASIEAQVAAKIAGEMAVSDRTVGDPLEFVIDAIPRITQAIRQAAQGKSESGSRPPDGPSPTPDSDKAEGEAPGASPSGQEDKEDLGWGTGPMTAKQKARLNMLYGNAVTKAAREMFPEVTKVGDITETMAAALIEDKEQG